MSKGIESADERPLHEKDPRWSGEVLPWFRGRDYPEALEKSLDYEGRLAPEAAGFAVGPKDRAVVAYTVAASAYGVLEGSESPPAKEWDIFFEYLEKYVETCEAAAREKGLRGWFPQNAKTLFKNALELACRFAPDRVEEIGGRWAGRFAGIDAEGWGHDLVLSALTEKIFDERIRFDRPAHVENTHALCAVYLAVSEPVAAENAAGRTQVMNLLSDLAYFRGGEEADEEALKWARRALEISPDDRFAAVRKKFLEERRAVQHQIRRFTHDTENTMAGIQNRLEMLLNHPEVSGGPVEKGLRTLRRELRRIHGVNRFIRDENAVFRETDPAALAREAVSPFLDRADIRISSDETEAQWLTDPEYLTLILDNLVKNAMDAFERRKIPRDNRRIELTIHPEDRRIVVCDNAGGVDPQLKTLMFEPYVSSKGIQKETGLGLSHARMAMEKLRGELRFPDEQPEDGAVFEIRLNPGR
ncbi:MAG: ATP-binding protein [Desulfococcaceae bacterium]